MPLEPGLLDEQRIKRLLEDAGKLSRLINSNVSSLRIATADLNKRNVRSLTDSDVQQVRPELTADLVDKWLSAVNDLIQSYDKIAGQISNAQAWAAMEEKRDTV